MEEKYSFGILHGISENVTMVKLMDTVGNVNHAVIIVGYWIFESNYRKALPLTTESLNVICSHFELEVFLPCFKHCFMQIDTSTTQGK